MKKILCTFLLIVLIGAQYVWCERIVPIVIAGVVVGEVVGTIAEDVVMGVIEAENNNTQSHATQSSSVVQSPQTSNQLVGDVAQVAQEIPVIAQQSWFKAFTSRAWQLVASIPSLCKYSWQSIAALLFIAKK